MPSTFHHSCALLCHHTAGASFYRAPRMEVPNPVWVPPLRGGTCSEKQASARVQDHPGEPLQTQTSRSHSSSSSDISRESARGLALAAWPGHLPGFLTRADRLGGTGIRLSDSAHPLLLFMLRTTESATSPEMQCLDNPRTSVLLGCSCMGALQKAFLDRVHIVYCRSRVLGSSRSLSVWRRSQAESLQGYSASTDSQRHLHAQDGTRHGARLSPEPAMHATHISG